MFAQDTKKPQVDARYELERDVPEDQMPFATRFGYRVVVLGSQQRQPLEPALLLRQKRGNSATNIGRLADGRNQCPPFLPA
jgi:hypothetical protein